MYGMTWWRMHGERRFVAPWPRLFRSWEETWVSGADRLASLANEARKSGALLRNGGDYDAHDLEAWGGPLGAARLRMAVEDHPNGHQLVRTEIRPRVPRGLLFFAALLATIAVSATLAGVWMVGVVYLAGLVVLGALVLRHVGSAMAVLVNAAGARRER
jgi:hypothetical protein